VGEGAKQRAMMKVFERGGAERFKMPAEHVDRPDVVKELRLLLRPAESNLYGVVTGECGTGKSRAVQDDIAELEHPKGVVYFSPSSFKMFGRELAAAVGYTFVFWDVVSALWRSLVGRLDDTIPPSEEEPFYSVWCVQAALKKTAEAYWTAHGRPLVLVIDAADRAVTENAELLFDLQNFAKDCADAGTLRVVFVSSEGVALPLLQSRSAWSRAMQPLEVGQISDQEAVDYLQKRGVAPGDALDAVKTISGGRFSLLVAKTSRRQSNEEWLAELEGHVKGRLKRRGLSTTHKAFSALLKGSAHETTLLECGLSSGDLEYLVKENILSRHSDGSFSFQARYVQKFFEKRASS
jgi:hypothetical protein